MGQSLIETRNRQDLRHGFDGGTRADAVKGSPAPVCGRNAPSILMADEPTGALDTRTGEEIMAIFQRLNRDGKTVVVVTHEMDIAEHAHRIIRFKDGHIVSDMPVPYPTDANEALAQMVSPEEEFVNA